MPRIEITLEIINATRLLDQCEKIMSDTGKLIANTGHWSVTHVKRTILWTILIKFLSLEPKAGI